MRPDTRNPEAYFRFRFGEGIPAKGSDMFGPSGHLGTILCMPPSLQAHPERERESVCVCEVERATARERKMHWRAGTLARSSACHPASRRTFFFPRAAVERIVHI